MRYGHAAAIFATILEVGGVTVVERKMVDVGASIDDLRSLLRRYEVLRDDFGDPDLDSNEVEFVSWLVADCGPSLRITPTDFEDRFVSRSSAEGAPICPRWALSLPAPVAYYQRLPAAPLFDTARENPDLARAYAGLLEHLEHVYNLNEPARHLELLNSAFTWRIVALADHLQQEDGTDDRMAYRLGRLRFRTIQGQSTSSLEQDAWALLDEPVVLRRHALTHLGVRRDNFGEAWDFCRCVEEPFSEGEILKLSAAISSAVLEHFAVTLRDSVSAPTLCRLAMEAKEWVDPT